MLYSFEKLLRLFVEWCYVEHCYFQHEPAIPWTSTTAIRNTVILTNGHLWRPHSVLRSHDCTSHLKAMPDIRIRLIIPLFCPIFTSQRFSEPRDVSFWVALDSFGVIIFRCIRDDQQIDLFKALATLPSMRYGVDYYFFVQAKQYYKTSILL